MKYINKNEKVKSYCSASGNRTPLSRDLFGAKNRHWQAGILTDILTRNLMWKAETMTHTMYILLIQMIYFYHNLFFNVKNSFQTKYINHNHLLIFKGTEGNVVENGESSIWLIRYMYDARWFSWSIYILWIKYEVYL